MEEQVSGRLVEVVFHNARNGFTVGIFKEKSNSFTGVGCIPNVSLGNDFLLTGKWTEHPVYGTQFAFSTHSETMPETGDAIELFLASGAIKGVGPKTAASIVEAFGDDALKIIDEQPSRLVEIDGIGPKKAAMICESFHNHREFAQITLYFQQFGISPGAAMKMYKIYGANTIDEVKENPYQLIDDLHGVGFKTADRIAVKMGVSANSPHRIKSGILYILHFYANDGNTFLPKAMLLEKSSELMDIASDTVEEHVLLLTFDGKVRVDEIEDREVVFLEYFYVAEQSVCKDLLRLERSTLKPIQADIEGLVSITEHRSGIKLSDNQKHAVRQSLNNGVFVITGGPGPGKTTIINAIISILTGGGLSVGIAAPTGRAAKRITETSGYEAFTIHRMLEYSMSENDNELRFGKNRENPLKYDAVIIDEASMVDILLMKCLLDAIPSGARLIIVGDADQLPSVGPGNVLRDMISSEIIDSVRLTEIFRQARESLIVVNAHKINNGEYPEYKDKDGGFYFLHRGSDEKILEAITDLCINRLPAYYQDIVFPRDLQIMTPVRKGALGSIQLNKTLQEVINPHSEGKAERSFGDRVLREGDKVMQIRNNYQMEWRKKDGDEGEGIFNGDLGVIQRIDNENGVVTVIFEETRYVDYDFSQIEDLELAYAVTVHKSQGSEFPLVLMPITRFPRILATRNLLYTAVTRSKRTVILVGIEDFLKAMVDNNLIKERYSGLSYRLSRFLKPLAT